VLLSDWLTPRTPGCWLTQRMTALRSCVDAFVMS
jgi:hypothetical protein